MPQNPLPLNEMIFPAQRISTDTTQLKIEEGIALCLSGGTMMMNLRRAMAAHPRRNRKYKLFMFRISVCGRN